MFYFIAQTADPVINGLDVVKAVDDFYQHAWLMLTVLFVLFGSLIGIVMPLIMQRIQLSSFNKSEKRLKDEIEQIKKITQESIQEKVESTKREIDKIQKDLVTQIDKETRTIRAEFYSQLGNLFSMDFGQKLFAFVLRITSATEYAVLKQYDYVTEELNRVISEEYKICIHPGEDKSTAEKLAESTRTMLSKQVDELCEILKDQGVKDRFSEQLAKVYDFFKSLIIVADKP
jgi:vacuolar-type H+-ATPase subunit I/STV1